jgi:ABC-type transporter lipoprotein component MlaA
MPIKPHWLAAAAILASAPLLQPLAAQSTAKDAPHAAADAREMPVTAALNSKVDSSIATTEAVNANAEALNAEQQAQYAADRQTYIDAMRAHHREVIATDAHYMHQQEAYAAAMHDWRVQVALCKHGHPRVCDLPTPDPANYM